MKGTGSLWSSSSSPASILLVFFLRVFHILETLGGFPSIEAVSYQRAELRASHHSNKGSKEHADDADQSSNCSEHIQGR